MFRTQIRSGALPPGRVLPSKRTLKQEHGIAGSTIDKAMAILKSEGLIRTEHGMGLYVTDPATWQEHTD